VVTDRGRIVRDDPNALLTRDDMAEALTQAGFPNKAATLATKARRGGAPYQRYGPRDRAWASR
jgi:hypothetical protein